MKNECIDLSRRLEAQLPRRISPNTEIDKVGIYQNVIWRSQLLVVLKKQRRIGLFYLARRGFFLLLGELLCLGFFQIFADSRVLVWNHFLHDREFSRLLAFSHDSWSDLYDRIDRKMSLEFGGQCRLQDKARIFCGARRFLCRLFFCWLYQDDGKWLCQSALFVERWKTSLLISIMTCSEKHTKKHYSHSSLKY